MIVIRIRWRVIYEPVCWLRGHIVNVAVGVHASDGSAYFCRRCDRRRPTLKIVNEIRDAYSYRYVVSLDWNGNEIRRSLQASNDPNADFYG